MKTLDKDQATLHDFTVESIELKRIKRLIKFMNDNNQPIAANIFTQLVFIDNLLTDLQGKVEDGGTLEIFEQGAQSMLREAPALTTYNKTLQRYNQTLKQFIDLLPVGDKKPEQDALLAFIGGGKD